MKIAIITFHRAINYGAVLQTYALSRYLRNKGHIVDVLDYRSAYLENSYKLHFPKNIVDIKKILLAPLTFKKKYVFNRFKRHNLNISKKVDSISDLKKMSQAYDYVITGSDQVWNARWTDYDDAYLLSFCPPEKRISYAASIGKEKITDKERMWLESQLKYFRKLSVRENSGRKVLEFLNNKNIHVNCDPVALLEKETWASLATKVKEDNYILVYMLVPSELLITVANRISKLTGKKIIIINDNIRNRYNAVYKRNISPEKFVSLFQLADYVVTNSFHGTMFSVIFEKNLYVVLQEYQGAPNARFTDLLKDLNMEQCIISDSKDINIDISIDYVQVKAKLNEIKIKTDDYFEELMEKN